MSGDEEKSRLPDAGLDAWELNCREARKRWDLPDGGFPSSVLWKMVRGAVQRGEVVIPELRAHREAERNRVAFCFKHREKLLQDIVTGLKALEKSARSSPAAAVSLSFLEVHFKQGDVVLKKLALAQALDSLVNDVFWDVDSNWLEADSASVEVT